MHKLISRTLLVLIVILLITGPAAAQSPDGPTYIVQPGDTLSTIAARFNIRVEDLMNANNISNPDLLSAGQQLVIPGLQGVSGVLTTEIINFGDSYRSLVRRTQVPVDLFQKLNRLVSPTEFYVGASMIVPQAEGDSEFSGSTPAGGETLLELAVRQNANPWTVTELNHLAGTWDGLPGDVLYTPGSNAGQPATGLPPVFASAEIKGLPLKQGGTGVVIIKAAAEVSLSGMLVDHPLHFFSMQDGTQVALQGVHALLDPGVYPLRLDATLPDGTRESFEQMVMVVSGNYSDLELSVPSETLDPSVTEPENQQILTIVSAITAAKSWQGTFNLPVAVPYCIKDWFGIRRTYYGQGSDITLNGFHSGLDFGICSQEHPYDIYAPAPGTVVFSGPLTVRGNATIIDHGWGVFSGFWHQEQSYVAVGHPVETGTLVGKIGGTGRVTGPHLHWEVWVNGVQVEPLDWLNQAYP